jgi:fucose permease
MVVVTLGPVLDSVLRDLDIPLAQGGLPALSYFLGIVVGLLSLNALLARVPVKWCLVGAALVESVGLAATGLFAHDLWSFVGAYFFVGLPAWVLSGIGGMWISAHVREKTAWALNLVMLSSVTGMTATPLVVGLLLSGGVNWRMIYVGEAVITVMVAVAIAVQPLADIPGRENVRPRHLKAVAAHNPWLLAAIGATSFMYLGCEMSLATWLPKFEVDVFGATATWAGMAVTFYFVGQIAARLVSIPLTRRFLASSLLVVFAAVDAVFIGAVAASPTQALSLGLTFIAGFSVSASFSLIGSYSSRFPLWYAGVAYSVFQLSGGVGSMVFPYLIGPVAAGSGFRTALAVTAIPMLIVAFLALGLRRASGEGRR